MRYRPAQFRLLPLMATLVGLTACHTPTDLSLHRENATLRETVAQRDRQLEATQAALDECNRRLETARAIPPDQLKLINTPERLVIATITGGADYDGQPGDDGVTVYLRPVDRDGDALKAIGDIRVELFDLAAPGGPARIGLCEIPAAQVRDHWFGQFMTQHYTVKCPWSAGPPTSADVTVRATFVDLLTQRVLTAQTAVSVRPAPR